jgi:xanthine dehydrogenase accessory factor
MDDASESVLQTATRWLEGGARVALATVTRTWTSSPRPAGSQMIVDAGGRFEGSVSGGCVETAVIDAALDMLAGGAPRVLEFGVSDARAWEVGLACGGRVEVFVGPAELPAMRALAQLRAARDTFGVATDLRSGHRRVFASNAVPRDVADAFARLDERTNAGVFEHVFVQRERPPLRIVVVGAVHIAQALDRIARLAGFELIVIDPRAMFASTERFERIQPLCEWPEAALARIGLDASSALLVLSHDPKLDDPALVVALRSNAFYVGALGSRKTHAARLERLRAFGVGDAALARIVGPVGLPIGAKTTAEIAISIMAHIVTRLRVPGSELDTKA